MIENNKNDIQPGDFVYFTLGDEQKVYLVLKVDTEEHHIFNLHLYEFGNNKRAKFIDSANLYKRKVADC
jgi:hypothetical protein